MQGLLEAFFIQAGGSIPSQTRGVLVRMYLYQLIFIKNHIPPPTHFEKKIFPLTVKSVQTQKMF